MKIFSFNLSSEQLKAAGNFNRLVLFIFGVVLIVAVIIKGVAEVSAFFLPNLVPAAQVLMTIFFLIIYPLSFLPQTRSILKQASYMLALLLSACAWLYALLFVMNSLGFWGLLFCFLFNTLTPITLIGAVFKGAWNVVGNLSLWLIVSFVIKLFSKNLSNISTRQPQAARKGKIIDIEAQSKDVE
jgi:hypothetical protein